MYQGGVVNWYDVKVDISHPIMTPANRYWIINEWYESEEADILESNLPKGPTIELGGCFGLVSCLISNQNGGYRHIVVEPNPEVIPVIENTKQLNGQDFEVIEKAYSATGTEKEIYLQDKPESTSLRSERKTDSVITVETVSLKELVNILDEDSFSLVVDIEGAEFELLDEELDVLKSKCKALFIEFHEFANQDIESCRDELRQAGFVLKDVEEPVEYYSNSELEVT